MPCILQNYPCKRVELSKFGEDYKALQASLLCNFRTLPSHLKQMPDPLVITHSPPRPNARKHSPLFLCQFSCPGHVL